MKILQICNAYQSNVLYRNLFNRLIELGVCHEVIAPGKNGGETSENNIKVHFFQRNNNFISRLLWPLKIKNIQDFAEKKLNVKDCDLIHAHTLFSDGAVAYRLHKKYSIDYLVAVRNTDLNDYFPIPLMNRIGYAILLEAKYIFLISEANRRQLFSILPKKISQKIRDKVVTLPNGIDDFWLSNINKEIHEELNEKVKLIYAGDICKNKNIHSILKMVQEDDGKLIQSFTAIGLKESDNSSYVNDIKDMAKSISRFRLLPKCKKEELIRIYRSSNIYIQPSFTETFGLTYIEALTQGIPVIYSKGQGIDGMFDDGLVGYPVNPNDPSDIYEKIKLIYSKYSEIVNNIRNIDFSKFSWKEIALEYKNYYEKAITK